MDIAFEVMIPIDAETLGAKFNQPVFEWGGVIYPQGPEMVNFHYFRLEYSNFPAYLLLRLPDNLKEIEWKCISVVEGLGELNEELWNTENVKEEKRNKLLELLNKLIGNEPRWFVNFEPNFDQIDEVKEGDINIVYQEILDSLRVKRKGFLIWHDISR
jgi:hypothetical protein